MALQSSGKIRTIAGITVLLLASWSVLAWGGPMKLIMRDGNTVEVPYYWITDGEYRFDVPGGIAGVPRAQVASVQEVVEAREFDPEVIMQRAAESSTADQRKMVQDLMASKTRPGKCETSDPEEGLKILKSAPAPEASADKPKIQGQKFLVEKSLPIVCEEPGGPVLVVQELVSSGADPKGRDFTLVLYDSEGGVLSKKTCEVYPLSLDQDALKKLQVKGPVFLVRASIKPDPKIKRYEIIATR